MSIVRVIFDGKVLVPVDPIDLEIGQVLELETGDSPGRRRGRPEDVLRAALAEPHLREEDVEELMRAIESGHRPARYDDPFRDPIEPR